ncbi:MAG: hypothetical protein ABIO29_05575 [Sphingomicrobium sp.]
MAAKIRVGLALLATAFLWGAAPSRAQDATNAVQVNSVGPRELENFNLEGTVTRPAEPRPAPAPTPAPRRETPAPAATTTPRPPAQTTPARPVLASERPTPRELAATTPSAPPPRAARPTISAALPPISDAPVSARPAPSLPPAPSPDNVPLPWLLAALALLGGAGIHWWRNNARATTAGGPAVDAFVAPAPQPQPPPAPTAEPAPQPAPAPRPPVDPATMGLVSTRLRPWVEVEIEPLRCIVNHDSVTIEVELTLFNSGSLPARAILLEAAILNAGAKQDDDIAYFLANPVGAGKRASSLPPLKKAVVRSKITTALKDAQQYEIEGRMVYVPILAVNVIYNWPTGEGQTGAAFIVGRETQGARLAPFRLDRGDGIYEPLATRPLEIRLRA